MDNELKTLLPGEEFKLINGGKVIVSPVTLGKAVVFSGAIASLIQKLLDTGVKLEDVEDWRRMFDVAFEETLNIMGLVLDKPREWFDTVTIGDGLGLIEIIVRQNFDANAKKNLTALLERLTSLLPTPSKPSSQRGTAGQKSRVTQSTKSGSSPEASSS